MPSHLTPTTTKSSTPSASMALRRRSASNEDAFGSSSSSEDSPNAFLRSLMLSPPAAANHNSASFTFGGGFPLLPFERTPSSARQGSPNSSSRNVSSQQQHIVNIIDQALSILDVDNMDDEEDEFVVLTKQ